MNHAIKHFSPENQDDLILEREETIASFSPKRASNKILNFQKKIKVRNMPISRELEEKQNESDRDESDMAKNIPIIKRIQRKEEEALGKHDDDKSFSDRLVDLADNPESVLMRMKTIFPFDLFPNTITIDPVKVTIEAKYFFLSSSIQTILIKDIIDTTVGVGPLTSILKIITNDNREQPVRITPLKKYDAEKAMKIIQGLVIARSESPDISKVEAIR